MKEIMIAVPGSGKTQYIVETIKQLDPKEGYAITFTRSAAQELKDRIKNDKVKCSTIHSLASTILSNNNVDFSKMSYRDMIIQSTKFLEKNPIAGHSVAIDEIQDISETERDFIKALCKNAKDILIVGDPNQSIFGFQGSSNHYMYSLQHELKLKKVAQDSVYRFNSNLCNYVNSIYNTKLVSKSNNTTQVELKKGKVDIYEINQMPKPLTILTRLNKDILRFCGNISPLPNLYFNSDFHPYVASIKCIKAFKEKGFLSLSSLGRFINLIGHDGYRVEYMIKKCLKIVEGNVYIPDLIDFADFGNQEFGVNTQSLRGLIHSLDELEHISDSIEDTIDSMIDFLSDTYRTITLFDINRVSRDGLIYAIEENHSTIFIDNKSDITLMTIHAAKGREFDNVLLHLEDRTLWSEANVEEEERVIYVALTRAKQNLKVIVEEKEVQGKFKVSEFLKLGDTNEKSS